MDGKQSTLLLKLPHEGQQDSGTVYQKLFSRLFKLMSSPARLAAGGRAAGAPAGRRPVLCAHGAGGRHTGHAHLARGGLRSGERVQVLGLRVYAPMVLAGVMPAMCVCASVAGRFFGPVSVFRVMLRVLSPAWCEGLWAVRLTPA